MLLKEIVTREEIRLAADRWCGKYSSPGDFEETGQQEAFFAGADSALDMVVTYLREYRKAYDESIFPPQDMEQYDPATRTAVAGRFGRFLLDNCVADIGQATSKEHVCSRTVG